MAEEKESSKSRSSEVQEAYRRAIQDFNRIDDLFKLYQWAGKYASEEVADRAFRYASAEVRDEVLLRSLLHRALKEFRSPYKEDASGRLGMAMAPDSQSFSFTQVLQRLCNGQG